MQISETYVNRTDLGRFDKWRFTLEERIEKNARVRAFYRRYFLFPKWAKDTFEIFWFVLGLLPLALASGCEVLVQKILADEDGEGRGEGIGIVLFLTLLGVVAYFHPIGWALISMTLQFVAWLWFSEIMRGYEEQLRREVAN